MNDQVFHQNGDTAFSSTDREQQVHHSNDHVVRSEDKDSTFVWLLQNHPQAMFLLPPVRREIVFLTEQGDEKLYQMGEVLQGRGLNSGFSCDGSGAHVNRRDDRGREGGTKRNS